MMNACQSIQLGTYEAQADEMIQLYGSIRYMERK